MITSMFISQSGSMEGNKRRRTRRCKKKNNVTAANSDLSSDNELEVSFAIKLGKKKRRGLRPTYNPNAPFNSTQYIMNEHFTGCCRPSSPCYGTGLEDSFADPVREDSCVLYSTIEETCHSSPVTLTSNMDIDYEYESTDCEDTTLSFMQEDFNNIMASYKESELFSKSKEELISDVYHLEEALTMQESRLLATPTASPKKSGSSVELDNLKVELEQLKQSNALLTRENNELRNVKHLK